MRMSGWDKFMIKMRKNVNHFIKSIASEIKNLHGPIDVVCAVCSVNESAVSQVFSIFWTELGSHCNEISLGVFFIHISYKLLHCNVNNFDCHAQCAHSYIHTHKPAM